MKRGKEKYGLSWPFSIMDMHVMDEYFKQYKDKDLLKDPSISKNINS